MGSREAPLSVRLCRQRVTSVSALGTVLHQQEQLWRVHAHPPDLQARDERGDVGRCEGMGAQGQSWGGIRDQAAGGTLGLWRRNWQERADLKYSHR